MSKHLWGNVYRLTPAETSPGAGIAQDYFGFHVESNRTESPGTTKFGRDAEAMAEESERARLNEGKQFSGFLAPCQVANVWLLVGRHARYGLCAYVDQMTSHADNRIEILLADMRAKRVLSRNEFFDDLLAEEIPMSELKLVCLSYLQVHIQGDRRR